MITLKIYIYKLKYADKELRDRSCQFLMNASENVEEKISFCTVKAFR